jgi:hypothetical protein
LGNMKPEEKAKQIDEVMKQVKANWWREKKEKILAMNVFFLEIYHLN